MASTRRFPGGVLNWPTAAGLASRDRILISSCVVLITAMAWFYLIHLDRQMSASMEYEQKMAAMGMTMHQPWSAADALFTFAMWVVMMVGMMAASVMPMLLLFAGSNASRGEDLAWLNVPIFGLGYFTAWAGFSVVATAAQWALHQAAMLSPAMSASSPRVAGGILLAAGVYQLTPWKGRCLTHCRSPLGFLMTNWRDGKLGAIRMGMHHGAYCLGCCWALMGVLFVVGVMNLSWVAVLAVFVLLEKIGPSGAILARVSGAVIAACGIFLIAKSA
jgi:predicted metal-binding membrane protein